jgi:hypothetical protein
MTSKKQLQIQEELATVALSMEGANGITAPEAAELLDTTVDTARVRIRAVMKGMQVHTYAKKEGTQFGELRYFANEAHRDHFAEFGSSEAAPNVASEFGDLRHPAPRTLLEGAAPLPTFINPSPTLREGADEARGLPSRRGDFLVYRDGTREPIHASA